jgi:hypothetical protein
MKLSTSQFFKIFRSSCKEAPASPIINVPSFCRMRA